MDPRYEQDTIALEESHWWYRGRRRIVRETVSALDLPRPADVLDAGCGSGRNLMELAPFGRLTGLERSHSSAEVARSRGIAEVVESGIEQMPFASKSFDLVICLDVIEHVADDVGALSELRRVARPGGRSSSPSRPTRPCGARTTCETITAAGTTAGRSCGRRRRLAGLPCGRPTSTPSCSQAPRQCACLTGGAHATGRTARSSTAPPTA
jgi:SAM-dependent methyltransferase